jgi:RimJ/RimL family protein N-acetyltransferase
LESKTAFIIIDKLSGHVIGSTRFYDYNDTQSSIAVGYTFLGRPYWGGVYNKSIKSLLINYAFQYVNKVILQIAATNLRSQMATIKLGAIKTGEFLMETPNEKRLCYEYAIYKDKWVQ